jgi:hypothetical protein
MDSDVIVNRTTLPPLAPTSMSAPSRWSRRADGCPLDTRHVFHPQPVCNDHGSLTPSQEKFGDLSLL